MSNIKYATNFNDVKKIVISIRIRTYPLRVDRDVTIILQHPTLDIEKFAYLESNIIFIIFLCMFIVNGNNNNASLYIRHQKQYYNCIVIISSLNFYSLFKRDFRTILLYIFFEVLFAL